MSNPIVPQDDILASALRYQELGLSVIPVGRDKKPLIAWQRYQTERATRDQIALWWQQFPDANVGIVTGAISGIVVIDVDAGGSTEGLPFTAVSLTGGGGWQSGNLRWTNSRGEETGSIGYQLNIESTKPNTKVGDIRLIYTNTNHRTGEVTEMDFKIPIVTTSCRYGGNRFWFICPLTKNGRNCGRRVGVLCAVLKWFGCRQCGDLVYFEQNEPKRNRNLITNPDVEKAYKEIKRFYYNGKPTKKHLKYMKMEERNRMQWIQFAARFDPSILDV